MAETASATSVNTAKQTDFKCAAVTFDFWNTLMFVAEPQKLYEKRMARVERVLTAAGHQRDWETMLEVGCQVWDKTMRRQYMQGLDYTPEEQVRDIIQRLKLDDPAEYFPAIYAAYTEPFLEEPPRLMAGAKEILEELAPRFKLGIICNTGATPGQVLRQLLKLYQLDHYFTVKTFSNELKLAKPNPEIFRHTLQQLGALPQAAVHVGDDPKTDVAGAVAVGMKTIWFNNRHHPHAKRLPDFTWRVSSLREIPQILLPLAKGGESSVI